MKTSIYTIPVVNLHLAQNKMSTINARAAKLGLVEMTMTVGDKVIREVDGVNRAYYEISIDGEYPVINGWRIIGTIQHEDDLHLINSRTTQDLKRYRDMEPVCEHCNGHRIKVTSFLVENVESGNVKAVGRGCLKNYIDADPQSMLSYLAWFDAFAGELEDGEYSMVDSSSKLLDVSEIMTISAMAIRTFGFSNSSSESPTREVVTEWLTSKKFRDANPLTTTDGDLADATEKHFDEDTSDSEFAFLINSLIHRGFVEDKWFAHLAGAVYGYTLHVAAQNKRKSYTDGYVGEIKKRMTGVLTLENIRAIESYYGTTYIHNFVDDAGHKLTWYASNDNTDMELGDTVSAKFTPKKHDFNSYDKCKDTIITRVAVA